MNNMEADGKAQMSEHDTRRMFETLQNTVSNQKVPKPTPDQIETFQQETSDWYMIKPHKNVDIQIKENRFVEFKKDEIVTSVGDQEEESKVITDEPLSFARR